MVCVIVILTGGRRPGEQNLNRVIHLAELLFELGKLGAMSGGNIHIPEELLI